VLGTQVASEEELGSCIPTVFQGNINTILLDAVRVWGDNKYRILDMYILDMYVQRMNCMYRVCTMYVQHFAEML
jgi:hypothetical protein